jgi:hypothetical protein
MIGRKLFKVIIAILLLVYQINCQNTVDRLKEGQSVCDCKSVFDCKPHKKLVENKQFGELRKLTTCGFDEDGRIPKYCCPLSNTTTPEISIPTMEITTTTQEITTSTIEVTTTTPDITISTIEITTTTPKTSEGDFSSFNERRKAVSKDVRDTFFSKLMNSCGVRNFGDNNETDIALRIVGGIEVVDPHMYPWMAGLVYESTQSTKAGKVLCGGVIISSNVVMTAAHCIAESRGKSGETFSLKKVRLGHTNLTSDESFDVAIDSILIHPNYTRTRFGDINDITLLVLAEHLDFNSGIKVKAICLPEPHLTEETLVDPKATSLIVAGWGATLKNRTSDILLELFLNYDKTVDCEEKFQSLLGSSKKVFRLEDSRMCASGPKGSLISESFSSSNLKKLVLNHSLES